MDKHIDSIVASLVFAYASPTVDAATVRAVRIMVRSMFNWTMASEEAHVGFQMQQIALILMPDDNDGIDLHMLHAAVQTFQQQRAAYHAECDALRREARQARIEANRSRLALQS